MKRTAGKEVDWSKADGLWTQLSNREIGSLLGARYSDVSRQRRNLIQSAKANGAPKTSFGHPSANRKNRDWSQADGHWALLDNREMARRLGFTYPEVSGKRKKLIREAAISGAPTTPFELPPPKRKGFDWSKADGLWPKMNNRQLAEAMGLSPNTVTIARRRRIKQAASEGLSPEPYLYQRP